MNPRGRPTKEDAVVRVGKRFLLWLSPRDAKKLEALAKSLEISKAEAIRRLLREKEL